MLDYFALGLLIFVALVLFYSIIAIHDIPYEIAKSRQHPQQDAIHVAGWISLFTLHAIWPFLWIWATLYRSDRGWGFMSDNEKKDILPKLMVETEELKSKIHTLEKEKKTDYNSVSLKINAIEKHIEILLADKDKNKEND